MKFLKSLLILPLVVITCCNEASVQNDRISINVSEVKCESLDQLKQINTLIETSGKFDSILGVLDNFYLPILIQLQHTCPDFFEEVSLKALLRCHKEEVDRGYPDGVLISNKAYDYLCLLLFQSSYMRQSQNYSSSSRTIEIFTWAKENKEKLSDRNRAYLSEIRKRE